MSKKFISVDWHLFDSSWSWIVHYAVGRLVGLHHHVMHIIFIHFSSELFFSLGSSGKVEAAEDVREKGRSENEIYSFVPSDKHCNVIYWRWSSINKRFIKLEQKKSSKLLPSCPPRSQPQTAALSTSHHIVVNNNNDSTKDVKKHPHLAFDNQTFSCLFLRFAR